MDRIQGIYEYQKLNDQDKEAVVFEHGRFLANRESGDERVNLYGLGDFYVEVFYHVELNELVRFRAFKSSRLLEPYLDRVSIDQLNEGQE